jgi:uncharacterized RDD family membrane protein YckC
LPEVRAQPAPAPAPGAPPQILRPTSPAPLRPSAALDKLPKAKPASPRNGAAEQAAPQPTTPPVALAEDAAVVDTEPGAPAFSDGPPAADIPRPVSMDDQPTEPPAPDPPPASPQPEPGRAPASRDVTPQVTAEVAQPDLTREDVPDDVIDSDEPTVEEPELSESPAPPPAQPPAPQESASKKSAPKKPARTEPAPQKPAAGAKAKPAPPAQPAKALAARTVHVAPTSRALLAALVDGTIAGALGLAVAALASPGLDDAELATTGPLRAVEMLVLHPTVLLVFALATAAIAAVHHAVVVPRLGGTLGARVAGLSLVRASTGAPPASVAAGLRGFVGTLGGVLLLLGPLYALWIDRLRRGPGDIVAGTLLVVRERGGRV